jgi:hypothetical protein
VALENKQKIHRTIVLNFTDIDYTHFMEDQQFAHQFIQDAFLSHPELFPSEMSHGYQLNGKTRLSKKLGIQMRKIRVNGVSYRIRPSSVLPYMRGKTEDVAAPLFLLRFGVPFWALAYVFGRNAMYWYRIFVAFAQFSIVGTTIRHPSLLPAHVLADEHHIYIQGEKAYVATTIALSCILGAEACVNADETALIEGYGTFKEEAQHLDPHYQPETVNNDGWKATQNAWQALFPAVIIIECFLHAFIKVRDRATKSLQALFDIAADKIWNCYFATSKRQMAQRLRRLSDWAKKELPDSPMKKNLLKLTLKKERWLDHLDFPDAYRTSNMLDRIMKFMARHAFNSQMFHGAIETTTKNFRAFALIYNFSPSSPVITKQFPELVSPAARLNGFVYHQNWLQNLLIAASLGGFNHHRNPL